MIGYTGKPQVQVKEVGHIRSPLQSDHNCFQTTVHRPEGISTFLPYISPWETAKQSRKAQVYHRLSGLLARRNSSYPQESENSFLRGLLVEWLCFDDRSFGDFASFGPSIRSLNFRRGVLGELHSMKNDVSSTFYTSWHHDFNDVEYIINCFWGFIHVIQIFNEFKHYSIGAGEPLCVAFIGKWYITVCPWKVRLTGFELQRRKTLSQVLAFLWESRCLNDFCCRDLCISVVPSGKFEPILRVPLVKCFFFQQQNIFMTFFNFCKCTESFKHNLFFTLKQWISRYYIHNQFI